MSSREVDKKISALELAKDGLVINAREILPPLKVKTQEALRHKRQIPYYKIAGRIYYQASELEQWAEAEKINIR